MVIRRKQSRKRIDWSVHHLSLLVSFLILHTGHGWDVKCVEWHPTKGLLVSGSKDNQIKFWDPRTGTVLSTLYVIIFHLVCTT